MFSQKRLSHFRLLLTFGLFCYLSGCISSNEPKPVEKIMRYGSGQISRHFYEINGKKEGKMTEYYPDGKLKGERFFKDGLQVDRTTIFYPSGKIKEHQYYKNGKLQGGDTVFYESGQLQFILEFNEGKKHGYLRKLAQNGSLTFEAKYQNDTLVEVKGKPVYPNHIMPVDSSNVQKQTGL